MMAFVSVSLFPLSMVPVTRSYWCIEIILSIV